MPAPSPCASRHDDPERPEVAGQPVLSSPPEPPEQAARRFAGQFGLASEGQYILLVAGFRSDETQSEPMVTVLRV